MDSSSAPPRGQDCQFFFPRGHGFQKYVQEGLVRLAWDTVRKDYPTTKQVLIRGGMHDTTSDASGKTVKDPDGYHVTISFKVGNQVERHYHYTAHDYTKGKEDFNLVLPRFRKEKKHSTPKRRGLKDPVWPPPNRLELWQGHLGGSSERPTVGQVSEKLRSAAITEVSDNKDRDESEEAQEEKGKEAKVKAQMITEERIKEEKIKENRNELGKGNEEMSKDEDSKEDKGHGQHSQGGTGQEGQEDGKAGDAGKGKGRKRKAMKPKAGNGKTDTAADGKAGPSGMNREEDKLL